VITSCCTSLSPSIKKVKPFPLSILLLLCRRIIYIIFQGPWEERRSRIQGATKNHDIIHSMLTFILSRDRYWLSMLSSLHLDGRVHKSQSTSSITHTRLRPLQIHARKSRRIFNVIITSRTTQEHFHLVLLAVFHSQWYRRQLLKNTLNIGQFSPLDVYAFCCFGWFAFDVNCYYSV
jgi:hypothetical protein